MAKYARFAAARLAQRELANARVIHGDAQHFFNAWLPDACVRAVHVYFPDPWWKARHKKRRVMNEPFLRDVERTLVPGGTLHFWTDVEEYFNTSLRIDRRARRASRVRMQWPRSRPITIWTTAPISSGACGCTQRRSIAEFAKA